MTTAEYRAICEGLGIHPLDFARLAGAKDRPGWARMRAEGTVPPAVAALARVAVGVGQRLPYAALATLLRDEAARLDPTGQG
ncbi:MAG: hypothetical protein ACOYOH_28820 [Paracraurococcus sp.]